MITIPPLETPICKADPISDPSITCHVHVCRAAARVELTIGSSQHARIIRLCPNHAANLRDGISDSLPMAY